MNSVAVEEITPTMVHIAVVHTMPSHHIPSCIGVVIRSF